jgi:hypothetical protein
VNWTFNDRTKWHRWFAWYPVVVAGQWVWLETVERREHRPLVWSDWTEYRT